MEYSNLLGKFEKKDHQHNIMVMVGNGFDINLMNKYGYEFPNGQKITTTYPLFYSYYKRNCLDDNNVLIRAMEKARNDNDKNWADFEGLIPKTIKKELEKVDEKYNGTNEVEKEEDRTLNKISTDLHKLQIAFSTYLSKYVDVKVENEVGRDSEKNCWAIGSLVSFLGDLDSDNYSKCLFPSYLQKYDIYNFLFVNLNFTNLLDNYIYLDQNQFDPGIYKTVDRNCTFYPNVNSYDNDYCDINEMYSSYLHVGIVHPHGNQHIARSLLFGADDKSLLSNKRSSKFNKEYWVQYSKYYQDVIDNTRLFIVYGCSLGSSDKWWWNQILSKLTEEDDDIKVHDKPIHSELLIYWYNPDGQNPFSINDFIKKFAVNIDSQTKDELKKRIFVISFSDPNKLNFLSLKPKNQFKPLKTYPHNTNKSC